MNCSEYRELIDDALDMSLKGTLERRVKLHLEHCAVCRDYYEQRRKEHVALFSVMNKAYANMHLPCGFADRVIAAVALEGVSHRKPIFVRIPRWALIAASLVLMAGFVFAATVVVDAVTAKDDDSEAMVGRVAPNAPDLSTLNDALTASETGGTRSGASDMGGTRFVASVPSTPTQQSTTDNQLKGEKTMTKRKAAAAALTAAMAAAPLAAANGDEYQFIISGDPVAAETEDSCSASSEATALTSVTLADEIVYDSELEARYRTMDDSNTCSLRSDKAGLVISFK